MVSTPVKGRRLVVHMFAPMMGDRAVSGNYALTAAWESYCSQLDLTTSVDGVPTEPDPNSLGQSRLAARRSADHDFEAVWTRDHDTACLSIYLTAKRDETWAELRKRWSRATRLVDRGTLLGIAEIYVGLVDIPLSPAALPPDGVAQELAELVDGNSWVGDAVVCRDGILVWAGPAEPGTTRFAALAPIDGDARLGDLIWANDHGPAPLTRYLVHMTKLRDVGRIRDRDDAAVRSLIEKAATRLDHLATLLVPNGVARDSMDLDSAWTDLALLQADHAGLVNTLANVRAMRRTVSICSANATKWRTKVLSAAAPEQELRGWLAQDHADAVWLDVQLADHEAYLQAASRRADQLTEMIERELNRQTARAEQQAQERQEHIVLVSTALITTLLTSLTAIQALGYHLPLPDRLHAPTIFLSAAAALLLSTMAVRRVGGIRHIAEAAMAAGAAWLGLTTAWPLLADKDAPPGYTAAGVLLAALGATFIGIASRGRSARTGSLAPRRNRP